jgi:hypothetical protein
MLAKKDNSKSEVKNTKNAKSPSSTANSHNDCCQPETKTAQSLTSTNNPSSLATHKSSDACCTSKTCTDKKGTSKTRLTIKYNAGYPNQLFIRGKGANLSWDKGQPLKNVKADEWVWETDNSFTNCEFKILINDHVYENGNNHQLNAGSSLVHTPSFY